jgi:hypothetical protein
MLRDKLFKLLSPDKYEYIEMLEGENEGLSKLIDNLEEKNTILREKMYKLNKKRRAGK